jgi:hypothetical protein
MRVENKRLRFSKFIFLKIENIYFYTNFARLFCEMILKLFFKVPFQADIGVTFYLCKFRKINH